MGNNKYFIIKMYTKSLVVAALVATTQAVQHNSIPACNSLGCKKGTAEDTGEAYLSQKQSIPACNSTGCKTGTAEDTGEAYLLQQHHEFLALQADMESTHNALPSVASPRPLPHTSQVQLTNGQRT